METKIEWPWIRWWDTEAIPGRWRAVLRLRGLNIPVGGGSHNPHDTLRQARQVLQNNGKLADEDELRWHIAHQWERLAGDRWIGPPANSTPNSSPPPVLIAADQAAPVRPSPPIVTIAQYGRPWWEMLNWTLANQGDLALFRQALALLDAALASESIGCHDCREHWDAWKAANPLPNTVAEARIWLHQAHQKASLHAKKRTLPGYQEVAKQFYWKPCA